MADEKVYTYDTIQETPFPNEVSVPISESQTSGGGNYSPATTKPQSFPTPKIAYELLSTTMNTRSRKILQSFDLQQSGGFQIGDYQDGVSGDLRITPNGITGRDSAGLTKFAIDTDGNAVFAGEIRSGSQVTGSTTIEEGGYILIGTSIFIGDRASL